MLLVGWTHQFLAAALQGSCEITSVDLNEILNLTWWHAFIDIAWYQLRLNGVIWEVTWFLFKTFGEVAAMRVDDDVGDWGSGGLVTRGIESSRIQYQVSRQRRALSAERRQWRENCTQDWHFWHLKHFVLKSSANARSLAPSLNFSSLQASAEARSCPCLYYLLLSAAFKNLQFCPRASPNRVC